jgi:SPP1 Gp6-like portal protein
VAFWDRLMAAVKSSTSLGQGELQDWLDEQADMGTQRVADYQLYEAFYNGEKGAQLRDRAKKYLEANGVPFCENFSDVIVDTLAERLNVIGFSSSAAVETKDADGKDVVADPFAALAEEWWQGNRMDAVQVVCHTQVLMKGDEYVIVEYDDDRQRPRFLRQRQHQVKCVYSDDSPDEIAYAVKVWNTSRKGPQNTGGRRVRRMNLYFPDHVEKWFRLDSGGKGAWQQWQDTLEEGWPVWWTTDGTQVGDPLGVPVIHLRHRSLGDTGGRSRVRQAIPFQEQLNKYVADLNDLVDNHALPQDWVTGVQGDVEFKRVAGNIWSAASDQAKFGRLEATPTSNLLEAIEGVLSRLARKARIPMHLLTGGTPPSGESLKTAESGLVTTAKQCQVDFGNDWEDAILLGLRLQAVFGDGVELAQLEGLTVSAQWANPETRSDKADLEAAGLKKSLGVSKHTLLQELGYDPEQEAERRAAEAEEAEAALGKLMNAGGPGE